MRLSPLSLLLPLATACHGDDFDVTVTVDATVPSIVRLAWRTPEPGRSWAEYAGPDDAFTLSTPVVDDGSTDHEAVLLGLPFLQECEWRAVTEVDGDERSAVGTVETGGMPSGFPDLRTPVWEQDRTSPERFLAGTFLASEGLFAVDRGGGFRWFHAFDGYQMPEFEVSREGTVLFNSYATDHSIDVGEIHEVSWDGTLSEDRRLVLGHHSFTELPNGDIAYVAADIREWYDPDEEKEVTVVGDQIRILPDDGGESWTLFSTWDWQEPAEHDRWRDGFYPQGFDWTHANAVRYDEPTDTFLLSLRNLDTILEIDASTARVLRTFGRTGYGFAPDALMFAYQHDPHWTPDRTLILLHSDPGARRSQAVEYEVDEEAGLLREVWRHGGGDQPIMAQYQGGVQVLANGNRLVNFGSAGVLREVTVEGDVVWELRGSAGAAFGAVEAMGSFYDAP